MNPQFLGLLALACAVAATGCLSIPEPPEEPELYVPQSSLLFQDNGCTDDVPIGFVIQNRGTAAARNVSVSVRGGYRDNQTTVATIGEEESVPISLVIGVRDDCAKEDVYNIVVTARPQKGNLVSAYFQATI